MPPRRRKSESRSHAKKPRADETTASKKPLAVDAAALTKRETKMAAFFAEESNVAKMTAALRMPELWKNVRRDMVVDDLLMFEWASKARDGDTGYADMYCAALELGFSEPHTTSLQPIYRVDA